MESRRKPAESKRSFANDDRGILQVLESIMAAMILLGAILFVTLTTSPVKDTGASGINLGSLAEDALGVLAQQPGATDPSITLLEEVVNLALAGDIDAAEDFLEDIVPRGTRYALRLDNGVEPLQLVPSTGAKLSTPRDASGAATYILSNWTAHSSAANNFTHGQSVDFSNWTSLSAPDGSSVGPGGVAWIDLWTGWESGQDIIPAQAPYGVWGCSGGCSNFRIEMPDGTAVDRQVYGVQLLLWDGV